MVIKKKLSEKKLNFTQVRVNFPLNLPKPNGLNPYRLRHPFSKSVNER